MEISEKLLCLFSAEVREADDGEYVVDVPNREIETGSLEPGETYRVALVARDGTAGSTDGADAAPSRNDDGPQPPVEPGEMRYVEVEDRHGRAFDRCRQRSWCPPNACRPAS